MWMGGCVPLGYDSQERHLIINAKEAERVRFIFERYLALGTVRNLATALEREGIRSKTRTSSTGKHCGGNPFSRGALYALLRNRLYVGEITHQGQSHPGQHEAIIGRDLFDAVQAQLDAQRQIARQRGVERSLLAGKLFDGQGHRLSPSHANKHGKRYRYYVSQAVMHGGRSSTRVRWPAQQLEAFIHSAVAEQLQRPAALLDADTGTVAMDDQALRIAQTMANEGSDDKSWIEILESATLTDNACTLSLNTTALRRELGIDEHVNVNGTWTVPLTVQTCHNGQKRIQSPGAIPAPNRTLVSALVNAHQWYNTIIRESVSIAQLARDAGRDPRYVKRLLTLVYLAPDVKHAILERTQPPGMIVESLTRNGELPVEFDAQRRRWGIAV